jgi:hypothetical protein
MTIANTRKIKKKRTIRQIYEYMGDKKFMPEL